jgi:hypothetical protein
LTDTLARAFELKEIIDQGVRAFTRIILSGINPFVY